MFLDCNTFSVLIKRENVRYHSLLLVCTFHFFQFFCLFSFFFQFIFILLKDKCFTEFCCFLANLNVNQPQVYIYLLPFEPLSHLSPHPTPLLLLLLSCFSRVRLCATPQTAAHQTPPSLGFSRQEYQSVLPLLSLKSFPKGCKIMMLWIYYVFSIY